MRRILVVGWTALGLLLSGCSTNEQTGQLVGGLGGGAIGAAIGNAFGHSPTAAAAGGAVGALGGVFIGGLIGKSLDQKDQHVASRATQQVLSQPPPRNLIATKPTHAAANTAEPPPTTTSVSKASAPTSHWTSDHTDARGSSTVVAVQPTSSGGECRTVHEIAYVGGQEISQDQQYCRKAGSSWEKV
jgi:surface antigen